ncbi:MarR family winged helix-turn-helix transcriptional regulator [Francisella marina]|uniref:MarR family transcriptional regulator n=1 Tax=Francisella marina TaxID=2249302 RepID=A0ABX5ZFM0_9GAMM|nr:MarR family transcriptional regulator [Francisella marina]QEO56804.1 MarR family transcriptional regulator [Francisella marina]QEO59078.1 MarR family transcriptional regulator [Francisella marina]
MKKEIIFTNLVLETFKASGILNIQGDNLTKEFGLTSSRWKILGAIKLSKAPMTIVDISSYMGQSRQAVQRIVKTMINEGLVKQVDNPRHKQSKYIELTKKANDIYELLDEKQSKWAKESSSCFNESDLCIALNVLNHINKLYS